MLTYKDKIGKGAVAFCICLFLVGMICVEEGVASEEVGRFRNSFAILGPATTPEYMGSNDYSTVPMLVSAFEIKSVDFKIEGLTAQAAFADWGGLKLGVTADVDPGRDAEVSSTKIAAMKEIDFALNVGGFVSYDLPGQLLDGDNFEFKLAGFGDTTSVHKGAFATLGVIYTLPLYIPWRFEFELETTFANDNYMDVYFGVDETDSKASGLPTFKAGKSFRDINPDNQYRLFSVTQMGPFHAAQCSQAAW